jgi:hypothetical protein
MKIRTSVSKNLPHHLALVVCVVGLVAVSALIGCSSFKSKKRLDMGRFAEDMITVAGEIQYSLGQQRAVYLRDYADIPELTPVRLQAGRAKQLVRGVIAYSIQLVTIGDSQMPEGEKSADLAEYLERVVPVKIEGDAGNPGPTPAEVDTVLANVRAQTRFLDAIAAAQPLVDDVSIASGEVFDELKNAMNAAVDATRRRIEERYGDILVADELLKRRQIELAYNLAYLRQMWLGVPGAADSLFAREPALPALVNARDGLDRKEILTIEQRILDNLRAVREIRTQLEPDLEMYYKQQHELDELESGWNAELRKARVAIVAWARAHKRMSQGVIDPADIDLLGIARKAAGSALPIP